jgi:catechol 2,3-dioxygenase-like lactoylglutathione lyase family enzyme
MEQRLSMVTLGVADLARSRRFYEEGLGWKASGLGDGNVVFFQLGGIVLALWGRGALAEDARLPDAGSGFGGIALAHNVRRREEADAVLAQAEAAGGRILKPAQDTFWGGYAGYFADPDGHLWEVAWNPHFTLGEDGSLRLPA